MTAPATERTGRPEVQTLRRIVERPDTVLYVDILGLPDHEALVPLAFLEQLHELVITLCPDHIVCEACGEDTLCDSCGVGDSWDWCPHHWLCRECRFAGCQQCREDVRP